MLCRTLLWGMWLGILLPAGSSGEGESPKKVTGILGESATFPLESPKTFDGVLWFRNEKQVAILRQEPPRCQLRLFGAYDSRDVAVSQDCGTLTVRGLREEDSAEYKAQMQNNLLVVEQQTFILKVYKRLSEADLKVTCIKGTSKDGNKTLHLNCSVGNWEDSVEFSWTSPAETGVVSSSGKSLLLSNPQDYDGNVTCTAENPVGNASRTVSLKQACAKAGEQQAERPRATANPETDAESLPPGAQTGVIVGVTLPLVAVVTVAAGVWTCRRKKTVAESTLITSSSHSGPKECKSLYAEIENVPKDAERERPQQRRGPESPKEVPITIYADVQHPEKTSLQTDDEKMRKEKRKAAKKSEKTIYSEISDRKEPTEEKLKTIYDTVNLLRPPEASEYNKIL